MSPPGFRSRGGASGGADSMIGSSGPDSIVAIPRIEREGGRVQVKDFEVEVPGFGLGLPPAGLSFVVVSGLGIGFLRKRKKRRMTIAAVTPIIAGMSTWRLLGRTAT